MNFFRFLFTKTFVKQLLFAIVGLVILVFLLMLWLKSTTNHGDTVEVPNLAKMELDKVEDALDELDLRYEVMDSANYNPDYPRYSVIEQVPKAGKFVKENRKIYLALNPSGYAKIPVPNVLDITRRQGVPTLLAMGFKIGKVTTKKHISDNILELRHKGERLKPGTPLEKTAVIDLIVGDETDKYRPGNNDTDNDD